MSDQKSRNRRYAIMLILVLAALCAGLTTMLRMRFSTGDMYPGYSSYREDQLGTKILYESLGRLDGRGSTRKTDLPHGQQDYENKTLLYLGLVTPIAEGAEMLLDLRSGGRVVMTFAKYEWENQILSLSTNGLTWSTNQLQVATNVTSVATNGIVVGTNTFSIGVEETLREALFHDFHAALGLNVAVMNRAGKSAQRAKGAPEDVTETLTTFTDLYFDDLREGWRVIYELSGRPVIVERAFGEGTVVASTVTYPFTNRALRSDRATSFLRWAVGESATIVFDETHFGVVANQGVATLARKYHLEGLALGLTILAILFVWKSTARVVPLYSYDKWASFQSSKDGRDSLSGLENLLDRHVSRHLMIRTLLTVFKKSAGASTRLTKRRVDDINELVRWAEEKPSEDRDVDVYKSICTKLNEKE